MATEILFSWCLEHISCKYILSVLVHKDNKDISTRLTKFPSGPTHANVRAKAAMLVAKERSAAKLQCPVQVLAADGTTTIEKYRDVDHQAKKAKVNGMCSVIDKNKVDEINAQILVMHQLEEIDVSRMGRDRYEQQLVHLVNQMPEMLGALAPLPLAEEGGNADDDDSNIPPY